VDDRITVAVADAAAEDVAEICLANEPRTFASNEVGGLVRASCRPLGRRSEPKHGISMHQNSAADRL